MPKSISASVGRNGVNLSEDTLTVQKLLNGVSEFLAGPKPKLEEDSKCGPLTKAAILNFQVFWIGWHGADGRVDPDGPTLKKLNELNPDPVVPPPPPPTPKPDPLSTDFFIWLRFKGKFFPEPLKSEDFTFTVIDFSNNREVNYVFEFGKKSDIPPFPMVGSGGHGVRVKARKPSIVSGLGGTASYVTTVVPGSNNAEDRMRSTFLLFPDAWLEGGSGTGMQMNFDAHLFKPKANDPGVTISIPGRFSLL